MQFRMIIFLPNTFQPWPTRSTEPHDHLWLKHLVRLLIFNASLLETSFAGSGTSQRRCPPTSSETFHIARTCSNSIAKRFGACFCGGGDGCCTIITRYVAKWGIAIPRGGIAPFWGAVDFPEKVSRNTGYCSDCITISRDVGPLSPHA